MGVNSAGLVDLGSLFALGATGIGVDSAAGRDRTAAPSLTETALGGAKPAESRFAVQAVLRESREDPAVILPRQLRNEAKVLGVLSREVLRVQATGEVGLAALDRLGEALDGLRETLTALANPGNTAGRATALRDEVAAGLDGLGGIVDGARYGTVNLLRGQSTAAIANTNGSQVRVSGYDFSEGIAAAIDQVASAPVARTERTGTLDAGTIGSLAGVSVTARAVSDDGGLAAASADAVRVTGDGIGVGGGASRFDEIDYLSGGGVSEELIVDFETGVTRAEADLSLFFAGEHGGEQGVARLYRGDTLVGETALTATHGATATAALAADDGGTFDRIVFSAVPEVDGAHGGQDSSDFYLDALRFTTRDAASGAEATRTLDASSAAALDGVTVSARSVDADGRLSAASAFNVRVTADGIGVGGGESRFPEIDFLPRSGVSEELIVAFEDQVTIAEASLSLFFAAERQGERGVAQLFRGDTFVGETVFTAADGSSGSVSLSAEDGGTFDRIVFSTIPEVGGVGDGRDSSDYYLRSLRFTVVESGTSGDGQAGDTVDPAAAATLARSFLDTTLPSLRDQVSEIAAALSRDVRGLGAQAGLFDTAARIASDRATGYFAVPEGQEAALFQARLARDQLQRERIGIANAEPSPIATLFRDFPPGAATVADAQRASTRPTGASSGIAASFAA